MSIKAQLRRWQQRGQIDAVICENVLRLEARLAEHWQIDISTAQVEVLLLHVASSLGRIGRGGCVSPLYRPMFEEMRNAELFPMALAIHQDLLQCLPAIPEAEQSYFLANIYTLVQEQQSRLHCPINEESVV